VATNSAADSQPLRPPAALNFSMPFSAYSANDKAPLWSASSLSKFLCRGRIFVRLDLAVLVLVVAAEAPLLARLGVGFGRLERFAGGEQRRACGACGRRIGQTGTIGGTRLPDEECAGQQEEAGGSAGKESQQGKSPWQRRFGTATPSGMEQLVSTAG
jgi:hypothetical protein